MRLRRLTGFVLVLGLAACAEGPRPFVDPRPLPTADQKTEFHATAIAAGERVDPYLPISPDSKSTGEKVGTTVGAGAGGAGLGALIGLGCGPGAFLCVPVMAAAGGATGLVAGAAGTFGYASPEEANQAAIELRNSLELIDVGQRLATFVSVSGSTEVGGELEQVSYDSGSDVRATFDRREIDTLLLIEVPRWGLVMLNPNERRNPNLRLEIKVDGKLYKRDRTTPAFERRWIYDSELKSYFDWSKDQGALVAKELDQAIDVLGQQIVTDFFKRRLAATTSVDASEPKKQEIDGKDSVVTSDPAPDEKQEDPENGTFAFLEPVGDFFERLFSFETENSP